MDACGIITLTTDFGLSDPYVGIMKGVILSINPNARIVDISHQVDTGAISSGATMLRDAHGYFPDGTIHTAVVDPGVGTERRPILVRTQGHLFVGPDNGIFWPIIRSQTHVDVIHLTQKDFFLSNISKTFHGRDIFAPVAAHLSRGIDPLRMGIPITDPAPLELPAARQKGDALFGEVIRIDHFGNLITNIHAADIQNWTQRDDVDIKIGTVVIQGIKETFGNAKHGELLALIGSSGYIEIAVNRGRADERVAGKSAGLTGMAVKITERGKTTSTSS